MGSTVPVLEITVHGTKKVEGIPTRRSGPDTCRYGDRRVRGRPVPVPDFQVRALHHSGCRSVHRSRSATRATAGAPPSHGGLGYAIDAAYLGRIQVPRLSPLHNSSYSFTSSYTYISKNEGLRNLLGDLQRLACFFITALVRSLARVWRTAPCGMVAFMLGMHRA